MRNNSLVTMNTGDKKGGILNSISRYIVKKEILRVDHPTSTPPSTSSLNECSNLHPVRAR